jgi:NTP pyrophosphatase (non-canonical NTP hydrolase)
MEMKDLQKFAKEESERLKKRMGYGDKEFILTNAIKLGEELGEVNEEVLKYFKYARKEKMVKENELAHEIADVLIVSTILAESLGIDIEGALKEKIKIAEERYK